MGSTPVSALSPQTVIGFAQKRAKEGAGPVTVSSDLIYLGAVLRHARAVWRLDTPQDVIPDAREALKLMGLSGKSVERERRVSDAEIAAIKAEWRSGAPVEIIDFAVLTTMRLGEICRIRWADLNAADRTIRIRDRKHPQKKIGNDQTAPLLNGSLDLLAALPRVDDRCWPFKEDSVGAAFQRARDRAGIGDVRFHDLRHEGISRLFKQGYQIPQVALVSDHRDWASLKRYTHIEATDLHRDA